MNFDWLDWAPVIIPVAVFVAALIATFWLRRQSNRWLERRLGKMGWEGEAILVQASKGLSALWCLIISGSLALAVSSLVPEWKAMVGKGLGTLFVISVALFLLSLAGGLISLYGPRLKLTGRSAATTRNITRAIILVITLLVVLDMWRVPTTPILLLIAILAIGGILAFRNAVPNLFAGLELSSAQRIKVGEYIKLETGEEGYVAEISWNNTRIKALDESTIIVPNSRLLQGTVINYGRPLKKARDPFRFHSRIHLTELTGLKARNLHELSAGLKTSPDAVIYFHTHHFLEEHHYLTPEPSNDFGLWVTDALGDEVLGERLASVDTFEFPNLGSLKERVVSIIDEYLVTGSNHREAAEGREFYFMKSISVVFPTPYVAHDLREFVEALRKVSIGSLYFHIFESRLRLSKGLNDFTIWLKDSLDEAELGEEIARLDPYTYTLEGLRTSLIQLIEKRIK
ncbi:MAG: DUF5752 family protein [Chloroflexota bacterium]